MACGFSIGYHAWRESMQFVIALTRRVMQLTPAQALAASPINTAYAIGMGDQMNRLDPGKQADLPTLEVANYRHLAYRLGGILFGQ